MWRYWKGLEAIFMWPAFTRDSVLPSLSPAADCLRQNVSYLAASILLFCVWTLTAFWSSLTSCLSALRADAKASWLLCKEPQPFCDCHISKRAVIRQASHCKVCFDTFAGKSALSWESVPSVQSCAWSCTWLISWKLSKTLRQAMHRRMIDYMHRCLSHPITLICIQSPRKQSIRPAILGETAMCTQPGAVQGWSQKPALHFRSLVSSLRLLPPWRGQLPCAFAPPLPEGLFQQCCPPSSVVNNQFERQKADVILGLGSLILDVRRKQYLWVKPEVRQALSRSNTLTSPII